MSARPTDMLEEEHRYIQKVVGAMAVMAEALEMGQKVDVETLKGIVEFMRTFADKCHHGKEEAYLFPTLVGKGVPVRGCPLAILTAEHLRGRTLVRELSETTEAYAKDGPEAKRALVECLRDMTNLYPNHIWKEDYLLFPMTNKILTSEEQQELQDKFEKVEESIGRDVHHRFERMALALEEKTRKS
ncbi:MAG: hemerythrin domain-containing protein [Chloroflexi bacterium]|nr:hemerythrin domain-containing protein [Chloroflexota bacterium]